ncbi:porin family protein, partial [Flavihumibacter sp. CACIAM 22H1]|uniref:porin family protein n=1 Tax=Flavihumibacter sp. CACIAM 22H1 TaxID=1812911 RepID=UPI000AB15B90
MKKINPRIAVKAGLFGSRFQFNNLPEGIANPKGDDAFYAGLQLDIPIGKSISITPELLYAESSATVYDAGLYSDFFSHVFLPVLLRYRIGKVSILAGPQAEFLLSAKGWYFEKAPDDDPDYRYYLKSGSVKEMGYTSFTLSGIVGAEWIFKYRFGVDARYKFGITNFRSDYSNPDFIPFI